MFIDTASPRRLYRQIADQLARSIENREFAVGSRLPPERELAELLGVSRPSIREALIALEIEGLVEVRGGSGVFVLERAARARRGDAGTAKGDGSVPAQVQPATPAPGPFDIIRARWIVESEAAALAATNASAEHLQRMKTALTQMRAMHTHSAEATAADERFHLTIAEASGNVALLMVVQQLWQQRTGVLYMQLESHFSGATIWREALLEHDELMDAIASREPDAARQAMRKHMKNAERRFASGWKASEQPQRTPRERGR